MNAYTASRQLVVETCHLLAEKGLLIATGGNVSLRMPDESALAITPSGRAYQTLTAADICLYSLDGQRIDGALKPSIEIGMHTAVYRHRPDVNAVVHTHQPYASIFALLNEPIPALFDEQVMQLGNIVELVPYGISGTEELANNLAARLGNQCNAYILQNHGVICTGITMAQAVDNAQVLEKCAQVYYHALLTERPITRLRADGEATFLARLRAAQAAEIARKGV